jgi:hypothetical protein
MVLLVKPLLYFLLMVHVYVGNFLFELNLYTSVSLYELDFGKILVFEVLDDVGTNRGLLSEDIRAFLNF